MSAHEPHMQKYFQFGYNDGASGYHTHKYSKLLKATNRNGNLFPASYATLILLGKIKTSHLTFTKSNAEIEPMIEKIKLIRIATKSGSL